MNRGIFAVPAAGIALLLSAQVCAAQEQEDRTLLPPKPATPAKGGN